MGLFEQIPIKAGFTSMGELADLMMAKRKMQQERHLKELEMEQQAALKKYEIEQMTPYKTALMNYQNALTASLPMRYLTPQGKSLNEQSNVMQGASPAGTPQGQPIVQGSLPYYDPSRLQNTGMPQNPENQYNSQQTSQENNIQDVLSPGSKNPQSTSADQYNLKRVKDNVPAQVLSKNLYATNIDKTLDPKIGINIDDLTYYNNPIGQLQLKKEQAKDAVGLPTSPEYIRYKESEGKFDFLANQIRQFYGDSIQPRAMEDKIKKLDPRSGYKSAKVAKARFDAQKKLLENELQTYRDATHDVGVYTGGQTNNKSEMKVQIAPITPKGNILRWNQKLGRLE